jgi:hypothetical protein
MPLPFKPEVLEGIVNVLDHASKPPTLLDPAQLAQLAQVAQTGQQLPRHWMPYADPGMLQAAENALLAHQAQEAREAERRRQEEGFDNAIRQFRRNPCHATFRNLVVYGVGNSNFDNAVFNLKLFDFVVETLRPAGLPRAGPFVWCSPVDEDPTDFADTTGKDFTMATKAILTPPGVSSFLNLQKPRAVVVGGEPRYGLTLIFDKAAQARSEFKTLQQGIDEALKERWPARLPVGLKSPFHDGAEKAGQYEGYKAGDVFISPWSKDKPGAINARKEDIIDWTEFYAGWLVRANVRPFAYDQGGNKGCGLFLDSVQFLRPGKRLDGRKAASESFPDDAETEEMV